MALKTLAEHDINISGIFVSKTNPDSPEEMSGIRVRIYLAEDARDGMMLIAVGYGGGAQITLGLLVKW